MIATSPSGDINFAVNIIGANSGGYSVTFPEAENDD
jgi:hypothetical protein